MSRAGLPDGRAGNKVKEIVKARVINAEDLSRTITRLAHEIVERNHGAEDIRVVGLRTRGEFLARRIASAISELAKRKIEAGVLDVTFYRDDFRMVMKQPTVRVTDISFEIDGRHVILVDDVLYTGRTVRAALDALMDFGRPASIQLAVLVDRGHRELPIKADYVGKNVPTSIGEEIRVHLKEVDEEDAVLLVEVGKT